MKMFDTIAKDLVKQKAVELKAEKAEAEKVEAEKAEAEKVEAEGKKSDFPVFTTHPIPIRKETRGRKPLARIVCPFCENERKQNGVKIHIEDHHGVPGVVLKDLFDVQDGVKSLEDLVYEKFDNDTEINLRNLSDRVSKEEFGSWDDNEDEDKDEDGADLVDRKAEADPIDRKADPVDRKAEGNPGSKAEGNPGLKVERRRFNWIPFFSPFNRRRFKK